MSSEENGSVSGNKLLITVAGMLAVLMASIDVAIVNVAITEIQSSLSIPFDSVGWVSTAYMIANVIVIPLTGRFQRTFGFKNYFTISLILFTAASILCGFAWDLNSLVCARFLQGIGGGALIPTSQSLLLARYPKKDHNMATALFGIGAIIGPLLGPSIGGALVESVGWEWIFFINIPFGIFATIISYMVIKDHGEKDTFKGLDWKAFLALAVGLGTLQFVLEEGNAHDWFESYEIIALSILSLGSFAVFFLRSIGNDKPLLNLSVFKDKNFALASLLSMALGAAAFSATFIFSLYCGGIMRYRPMDIGQVFLAGGLINLIILPILGKKAHLLNPKMMMIFGLCLLSGSLYNSALLTQNSSYSDLVLSFFFRCVSLGFLFLPISIMALSHLSNRDRGEAAGLISLIRELGGSIATAILVSVINRSQMRYEAALSGGTEFNHPLASSVISNLAIRLKERAGDALSFVLSKKIIITETIRESYIASFHLCFMGLAIIILLCNILVLFTDNVDSSHADEDGFGH